MPDSGVGVSGTLYDNDAGAALSTRVVVTFRIDEFGGVHPLDMGESTVTREQTIDWLTLVPFRDRLAIAGRPFMFTLDTGLHEIVSDGRHVYDVPILCVAEFLFDLMKLYREGLYGPSRPRLPIPVHEPSCFDLPDPHTAGCEH
jgi:hypothetical protein